MSIRHWFLAAASVIGLVTLMTIDDPGWAEGFLLLSGGLAGIWAAEGERAHMKARGIELDPL